MRSVSCRRVYAYWRALCQNKPVPNRQDIDPAAIHALLPDLFILDAEPGTPALFRLAGTRLCLLMGREMRRKAFSELWTPDCRHRGDRAIALVTEAPRPLYITASGQLLSGARIEVDILMMPLSSRPGMTDRIFGCLTSNGPASLFEDPLVALDIATISDPDTVQAGPDGGDGLPVVIAPSLAGPDHVSPLLAALRKLRTFRFFEPG